MISRLVLSKRPDQKEVRVLLAQDVHSLLRKLAGVQEKSLNKLLNEAVERYLEDEDIKELIDRHRLESSEE
jgi:predicted HicB family RNase H-like nuclease